VRNSGRTIVYSTANPFLFSGRVLLQNGEGNYRIVDGTMTNCRIGKPLSPNANATLNYRLRFRRTGQPLHVASRELRFRTTTEQDGKQLPEVVDIVCRPPCRLTKIFHPRRCEPRCKNISRNVV
jgi:hypothetical protein